MAGCCGPDSKAKGDPRFTEAFLWARLDFEARDQRVMRANAGPTAVLDTDATLS